jgi:hypothetical protein
LSGQDPRDTLEYVRKEYPSMGRRQRADLVAKGMKQAGLTSEGKSPHKKGTAKHKKHMAAMHAGMGENVNEKLQIQKIKNSKGEIIQYTVLNGEPFDVNGAPLEYGQYWDIVRTEYSDIATNDMWSDYEKRHKGMKGYNENESMQELRKLAGLNEGGECYQCDGADEDCPQCNGSGYVQYDDDGREPSDDEIQAHADAYEIYKKHRDSKKESVTENVD